MPSDETEQTDKEQAEASAGSPGEVEPTGSSPAEAGVDPQAQVTDGLGRPPEARGRIDAKVAAALVVAIVVAVGAGVGLWLGLRGGGSRSGSGEQGAIKGMVEQFFGAFDKGDSVQLASLFSTQCGDMADSAASAIQQFKTAGSAVKVQVTDVDIQSLTENSAEMLPQGTLTIDGQESPISQTGDQHTKIVKENGQWRIAECNLFL